MIRGGLATMATAICLGVLATDVANAELRKPLSDADIDRLAEEWDKVTHLACHQQVCAKWVCVTGTLPRSGASSPELIGLAHCSTRPTMRCPRGVSVKKRLVWQRQG
jgi:hypothetical protein